MLIESGSKVNNDSEDKIQFHQTNDGIESVAVKVIMDKEEKKTNQRDLNTVSTVPG